jgi:hypothetical protein
VLPHCVSTACGLPKAYAHIVVVYRREGSLRGGEAGREMCDSGFSSQRMHGGKTTKSFAPCP